MTINLDDYKDLYLETTQELLDRLKKHITTCEQDLENKFAISEIHRAAHSLKSQSLVMGYKHIASNAHNMEKLYDYIKEGTATMTNEIIEKTKQSIEQMQLWLNEIKNT